MKDEAQKVKDASEGKPTVSSPVVQDDGKAKRRYKKREVKPALDKETLTRQIFGLHIIIAQFLKSDVWLIKEAEAAQLAEAVAEVSKNYSISLDGKYTCFVNLAVVAAVLYYPRYLTYSKALKEKKDAESTPSSSS